MAITFIQNDPLDLSPLAPRRKRPRPDPPMLRARFSYAAGIPEGHYAQDTPEFLFWQCREAALAALETWALVAQPLSHWANGVDSLTLHHDRGQGLNASYDRADLSFFRWRTGPKTTVSGASTDAVAHEVGHALLDAIRPDLWGSAYTEVAAFHEAFGDCLALLVGWCDAPTRQALLRNGSSLRQPNFLESLTEDVADGIRREHGTGHSSSLPRRALNTLQWEFPVNLPAMGSPAELTSEPHSFSRVFTGCFYDTVCNLFDADSSHGAPGLRRAAHTAGTLLIAAAKTAPEDMRFFQAVGRAMILTDTDLHGGAHHQAIRDAFAGHNVLLGSSAMLAPTAALAGIPPRFTRGSRRATLAKTTQRDLLKRIHGLAEGILPAIRLEVGGKTVAKAVHQRPVRLDTLDKRLKKVVAMASESVLVGMSGRRAAVLGRLPEEKATQDEATTFVRTLLTHKSITLTKPKARTKKGRRVARKTQSPLPAATHRVKERVLIRTQFFCGIPHALPSQQPFKGFRGSTT
ncbi:MAG: hypothetical protein ABW047_16425 [Nitrospiraceae bacterium]